MTDKNNFLTSSHNSYSQALYELALESKILDQIEDQISAVIKLITESKDFRSIINGCYWFLIALFEPLLNVGLLLKLKSLASALQK